MPISTADAEPLFLDGLSPTARNAVLRSAVERTYAPKETLFRAGDAARGLFVVLEGRVRVVRGRGARSQVVHTETVGGTLGEVPLFAAGGYPATAVASEPTRCLVLSRDALATVIAAHPEVAFVLLSRLAARVRGLVIRFERQSLQDVPSRLAGHILERPRLAGGTVVSLGMTQGELAEELGTVRELVVRALRRFREEGLVAAVGGNRFEIVDEARLREIAEL